MGATLFFILPSICEPDWCMDICMEYECQSSVKVTLDEWNLEWKLVYMCFTGSCLSFLISMFFSVLIKKMFVLYFLFFSICLCTTLHDVTIFRILWQMCTAYSKETLTSIKFLYFFQYHINVKISWNDIFYILNMDFVVCMPLKHSNKFKF